MGPNFCTVHPLLSAVSYTHLDVYKRQVNDVLYVSNNKNTNGTKSNGNKTTGRQLVTRNPLAT